MKPTDEITCFLYRFSLFYFFFSISSPSCCSCLSMMFYLQNFSFYFLSFVVVFRPVLSHFSLSLLRALLCFFLVVVVDMQSSSVSFFFPPLSFSHHRIWWWHDAGITSGCCLFLFFPFFQLIERQHASIFLFFLDIISCLFYMRHQLFQMSVHTHTHTYFSCIGTT